MRSGVWTLVVLTGLGASWSATPAAAQRADFLFRRPLVSVALRGGWAVPRAQSDIFEFTHEQLGIDRHGEIVPVGPGDFQSAALQFDLGVSLQPRLEAVLGLGVAGSEVDSESRGFVGTDDLPIEQSTRLLRVPVTAGLKMYLKDRGRSISRFAWVPAGWAPWVGVGAGGTYSEFEQKGEFVDYETFEIFPKTFRSMAFSPTAYLGGGLDFSLGPHLLATGEGRYVWGSAKMSDDFVDFDRIDLSGFQITAGVSARF